jgi:hypothetical protein
MIRSRFRMFGSRMVILLTLPMHPALAAPPRAGMRLPLDGNSLDAVELLARTLTSRAGHELLAGSTDLIRLIAG